jgi:hypothetical protein
MPVKKEWLSQSRKCQDWHKEELVAKHAAIDTQAATTTQAMK